MYIANWMIRESIKSPQICKSHNSYTHQVSWSKAAFRRISNLEQSRRLSKQKLLPSKQTGENSRWDSLPCDGEIKWETSKINSKFAHDTTSCSFFMAYQQASHILIATASVNSRLKHLYERETKNIFYICEIWLIDFRMKFQAFSKNEEKKLKM